ncbi:hypothetical protein BKA70DRAFT_1442762 [Coprinopsis sp. MPI-PUGE-AT-0042]|nr:hypothetical protein BKA70DRAFT_1442762 [Coprinopsis sp. MPI-PUGE-AT-0042]
MIFANGSERGERFLSYRSISGFPGSFGQYVHEGIALVVQNAAQHPTIIIDLNSLPSHTNPPKLDDALDAPTHRNHLHAFVAHSQSRLWFLPPLIVDTGSLDQTWGKVKQQVPWVNNQPFPPPPPAINRDGDPTIPNGADGNEEEEEEPVDPDQQIVADCCRGSLTATFDGYEGRCLEDGAGAGEEDVANLTGDYIPFFETTVRYLGGYISAYAFSGEKLLLDFGR